MRAAVDTGCKYWGPTAQDNYFSGMFDICNKHNLGICTHAQHSEGGQATWVVLLKASTTFSNKRSITELQSSGSISGHISGLWFPKVTYRYSTSRVMSLMPHSRLLVYTVRRKRERGRLKHLDFYLWNWDYQWSIFYILVCREETSPAFYWAEYLCFMWAVTYFFVFLSLFAFFLHLLHLSKSAFKPFIIPFIPFSWTRTPSLKVYKYHVVLRLHLINTWHCSFKGQINWY